MPGTVLGVKKEKKTECSPCLERDCYVVKGENTVKVKCDKALEAELIGIASGVVVQGDEL